MILVVKNLQTGQQLAMFHPCNPYFIDESVINRNVIFKSIELKLNFEGESKLLFAISKEIRDDDTEKIRLEFRDGDNFAIFDGKKGTSDSVDEFRFSASGTEMEDRDLVDLSLGWLDKQFEGYEETFDVSFENDQTESESECEDEDDKDVPLHIDVSGFFEPMLDFYNEFIDVINHDYN